VIAHVSSPQTIDAVDEARRHGADVWIETCHHYLCGSKDDALKDNRLKWNPPTRDAQSVDWMWRQLLEGKIHSIASDHGPLAKNPDANVWEQNPGAGNGVEVMFPVFATEALHRRGVSIGMIAELMAETPARLFRLQRKGSIAVHGDADFTIVETDGSKKLDAGELEYHEQERWCPFDGMELKVYPVYTVLRGQTVFAEGEVRGRPGDGRFLAREAVAGG
jgi:allantoinase